MRDRETGCGFQGRSGGFPQDSRIEKPAAAIICAQLAHKSINETFTENG